MLTTVRTGSGRSKEPSTPSSPITSEGNWISGKVFWTQINTLILEWVQLNSLYHNATSIAKI